MKAMEGKSDTIIISAVAIAGALRIVIMSRTQRPLNHRSIDSTVRIAPFYVLLITMRFGEIDGLRVSAQNRVYSNEKPEPKYETRHMNAGTLHRELIMKSGSRVDLGWRKYSSSVEVQLFAASYVHGVLRPAGARTDGRESRAWLTLAVRMGHCE